jgi:hypothetical protein
MNSGDDNNRDENEEQANLSLMSIVASTLAAAIGVQNSRNRKRDFKSGRMLPFIIAGVVFTLLFIGTVFTVVQLVLKNAGH